MSEWYLPQTQTGRAIYKLINQIIKIISTTIKTSANELISGEQSSSQQSKDKVGIEPLH